MKFGLLRLVLALTASVLALASCGQAASLKKPTKTSPSNRIEYVLVLNVIGQPVLSAISELAQHHIRVNFTKSSPCSNTFSLNDISAESPSAGTRVSKNAVVTLTTSSGSCAPPCPYVYMSITNQALCSTSPVLTDPSLLVQALSTAAETLMGSYPPEAQYNEFISLFQSLQTQQERDGALHLAWYNPDPASEANAFIRANDQTAVIANNAGQWGNYLNCVLGGSQDCNQSGSPSLNG